MSLKRTLFIGLPLVLIVLVALYYPVTETSEVSLPVPIERAIRLITEPGHIKKWYPPFTAADTDTSRQTEKQWILKNGALQLSLKDANTISATLFLSNATQEAAFFYHTSPDSGYVDQTKITMSCKKNRLGYFNGRNQLIGLAQESLRSLETYAGNTARLYGLDIRHIVVTDTAFLFTQATTTWGAVKPTVEALYTELDRFAAVRNAGTGGIRIINIKPLGSDSIRISVGLGIQQYLNLPLNGKIMYRSMPVGKRLLEASFKGRYVDLLKAFQGIDDYARDHRLTNVAIPYARFSTARYDYEEGDIIDMMVYYPVN